MPRILAIDYGQKRVGLAVTDKEQLIAGGLTTVLSKDVLRYLSEYLENEKVVAFVVGEAKNLNTFSMLEIILKMILMGMV